jgi:hypothetical protein
MHERALDAVDEKGRIGVKNRAFRSAAELARVA